MEMNGLIIIDKQEGISSAFLVRKFARTYGISKAGHAGTLDPMASGVLVVGVGTGTRVLRFFEGMDKTYYVEFQLGKKTDTDDKEGTVIFNGSFKDVSEAQIIQLLNCFIGEQLQRPPQFSAVKLNGRRAYSVARSGSVVDIPERRIIVYNIEFCGYNRNSGVASFRIKCSKGTYIRSIVRDIGDKLGCGAHLTKLIRESIGEYNIEKAIQITDRVDSEAVCRAVIPISVALSFFRSYCVNNEEEARIRRGAYIHCTDCEFAKNTISRFILVKSAENKPICIAIAKDIGKGIVLQPDRMLV